MARRCQQTAADGKACKQPATHEIPEFFFPPGNRTLYLCEEHARRHNSAIIFRRAVPIRAKKGGHRA